MFNWRKVWRRGAAPAAVTLVTTLSSAAAAAAAGSCPALLNHTMPKLQDESPQHLCQYAGKVVLVVNTASYCGFTPQYEGLEALYAKYKEQGLVILGFPSNDFRQEKSSNAEIADFCFNTYGVVFPMFAASSVRGDQANPVFKALKEAGAGQPLWNFYKYLIDRKGEFVEQFSSLTVPRKLEADIEKLLAADAR